MIATAALAALALSCAVTDGDTLRCGGERIRLIGIDAPELRGHCASGRRCAPGDPVASRQSLARALQLGPVRIERHGTDRYGRTLAYVRAGGVDLSCWQIAHGQAVYVPRWDRKRHVARTCSVEP